MPCFFIMSFGVGIIIVLGATLAITLLQSAVLLFMTHFITPSRNLFGFGGGLIVIAIFLTALWAVVYSTALAFIDSLPISLSWAFVFSLWMSWRHFQSAVEIYQRPDYFDRDFFVSDVTGICANFIIYLGAAVFIWKVESQFLASQK